MARVGGSASARRENSPLIEFAVGNNNRKEGKESLQMMRGRFIGSVLCFLLLCIVVGPIVHGCSKGRKEDLDFDLAVADLESQLNSSPDSEEILHKLATGYWWVAGDVDKAESYYRRLLEVNPRHEAAHFELAQVLRMRGRYAESVRHFRRMVDLSSDGASQKQYAQKKIEEYERVAVPKPHIGDWTEEDTIATNSLSMMLIRIPGGEFLMGCSGGKKDCRPEHKVYVDPYWIGKYEVTAGQFKQFLDETGYQTKFRPLNEYTRTADHPAVFVTWRDAVAFTMWLSCREGRVYRLPSEAEWELAARGFDKRTNPWGMEMAKPGHHANLGRITRAISMGKKSTLEKVGSYPAGRSYFGLFDMAGNAAEWCLDFYDKSFYAKSPTRNPFGPSDSTEAKRVLRGDSWRIEPSELHAVDRDCWDTVTPYDNFGFRVVCEIGQTEQD